MTTTAAAASASSSVYQRPGDDIVIVGTLAGKTPDVVFSLELDRAVDHLMRELDLGDRLDELAGSTSRPGPPLFHTVMSPPSSVAEFRPSSSAVMATVPNASIVPTANPIGTAVATLRPARRVTFRRPIAPARHEPNALHHLVHAPDAVRRRGTVLVDGLAHGDARRVSNGRPRRKVVPTRPTQCSAPTQGRSPRTQRLCHRTPSS